MFTDEEMFQGFFFFFALILVRFSISVSLMYYPVFPVFPWKDRYNNMKCTCTFEAFFLLKMELFFSLSISKQQAKMCSLSLAYRLEAGI